MADGATLAIGGAGAPPPPPLEPHITLARHEEYDRLEAALREATDAFGGEFGDVLREVTLLAVDSDGRISPLQTIPLATA